jgi:hypothetical protein
MPKKTTVKETKMGAKAQKPILMPEASAHIVQRELKFTPDQVAKMQLALDNELPLKMSLGLQSKIWGMSLSSASASRTTLLKLDAGSTGDDPIVDEPLQPPDGGGDIPTDEEPQPPPPEAYVAASFAKASLAKTGPIVSNGRRLVGAKVKVYAVAVFQPEFSKE